MIDRLIELSLRNRFLVSVWGYWALLTTPIDAIPDLSDNQVIVFTDRSGRSPQEVEDQVTYPLTVSLQGLPGVRVVGSSSAFGCENSGQRRHPGRAGPSPSRTAKVRIEVPNRGDLKLGMFVSVTIAGPGQRLLVVPRTAVQTTGERSIVYVALDEGRFVERSVRLGASMGEAVAVLSGRQPDERVVTDGSFFLRAEVARSRGSS